MKRWRNVIILGLVLAVLLAAYFLLKGGEPGAEPGPSSTPEDNPEAVRMLDLEREDIVKILLEYDGAELVLNLKEEDVEVKTIEDDGTETITTNKVKVWVSDAFPLEQSVVSDILYGGVNSTTNRLIESDPEDLSIYGLDEPVSVTFFDAEGNSQTIEVGNSTHR